MGDTRPKTVPVKKLEITAGQALLLLLDEQKKQKISDDPVLKEMKEMYLLGIKTVEDRLKLEEWIAAKPKLLKDYKIQTTIDYKNKENRARQYDLINKDPTRRYFETYLARHTLDNTLRDLKEEDLKAFQWSVHNQRSSVAQGLSPEQLAEYQTLSPKLVQEYNDAKARIGKQLGYIDEAKHSLLHNILDIPYYSVMYAFFNPNIPIDIYDKGIFGPASRRNVRKIDQNKQVAGTHNAGLLTSTMPLPLSDEVVRVEPYQFLKASDRTNWRGETLTDEDQAFWTIFNFSNLVNPHSNAISGTVLGMLRALSHFSSQGNGEFKTKEEMKTLLKCVISSLLYTHGGHSLNEFTYVLELPEVQQAFATIPGFSDLNLKSLFLDDNEAAINTSLDAAIEYNKTIINRAKLHEQITKQETAPLTESKPDDSLIDVLFSVAKFDNAQLFERILKENQDIIPFLGKEHNGKTLARTAATYGSTKIIRLLHEYKVDLNQGDSHVFTPAMLAAEYDEVEVVKTLLELKIINPASEDALVLARIAAKNNSVKVLRELFHAGVNLNVPDKKDGLTPAMIAADYDKVGVIKTLLELKIINPTSEEALELARIAAKRDSVKVLRELFHAGVDLNVPDKIDGLTPAMVAERSGILGVIKELMDLQVLKRDDYINISQFAKSNQRSDPFEFLAEETVRLGDVTFLEKLLKLQILESGKYSHRLYAEGETLVTRAAKRGNTEIIRLFHEYKVDLTQPNDFGYTPAMVAAYHGQEQLLKSMFELKIIHPTSEVASELARIAAERGHINVLRELLHAGVDLNVPDKNGLTPAMLAVKYERPEIFKALIDLGVINSLEMCWEIANYSTQVLGRDGIGLFNFFAEDAAREGDVAFLEKLLSLKILDREMVVVGPVLANIAADYGKFEVIKELIKLKAINLETDGSLLLNRAIRRGDIDIIQGLVEAGISLASPNELHERPVIVAGLGSNPSVLKLLINLIELREPDAINVESLSGLYRSIEQMGGSQSLMLHVQELALDKLKAQVSQKTTKEDKLALMNKYEGLPVFLTNGSSSSVFKPKKASELIQKLKEEIISAELKFHNK